MRRRRSSFRKEKAIMLASSCLVLTALTVTGLYVRNQRKELHPGEAPEACFALCEGDEVEAVYAYCNLHGLWMTSL